MAKIPNSRINQCEKCTKFNLTIVAKTINKKLKTRNLLNNVEIKGQI